MKSGCASCESAIVWALGQIIAQGRPDADWEAQSEANTLCKIIWDALAVCIFCENEYVVNGWCDKKGNFSSPDIYISHTKREVQPLENNSNNLLKKSFAFFSEF